MTRCRPVACLLAVLSSGCALRAQDDLAALSDEFTDPAALRDWQRVEQVEQAAADQLQQCAVADGALTLVPRAVSWYRDYRGPFLFKSVTGDFVVTAQVHVAGRAGGPPRSQYSLAGVMLRTPRQVTPQTWRPGGENYIFHSLGAAGQAGTWQWEVKTTVNSDSQLQTEAAPGGDGAIRIARIGPHVLVLRQPAGGAWQVRQRYARRDFPDTLQVGLCVYSDWPTASSLPAPQHNQTAIAGGNPDLVARFDYVRFRRPALPAALAGADLANPAAVPDSALVRLLGEPAEPTAPTAPAPPAPAAAAPAAAGDDLAALSDDFTDPAASAAWQPVWRTEGAVDQMQRGDVGQSRPGWLTLVPRAVTWYQDYRGPLLYKAVRGDFLVTTALHVTNRQGSGAPRSSYSLAGILVRAPRELTPQTWQPGHENYLFLSLGSARSPGQYEWEVKTTTNSRSDLRVVPAGGAEGQIRFLRLGAQFVLLKRETGGAWTVHQRYYRPDLPETLQVGLTTYTDYAYASRLGPQQHNLTAIDGGNPDLIAQFDYVRFARPAVPPALTGRAVADTRQVSDAELLAWLGRDG